MVTKSHIKPLVPTG